MWEKEDLLELSQESFIETYGNVRRPQHHGKGVMSLAAPVIMSAVPLIMSSASHSNAIKKRDSQKKTLNDDDVKNNNSNTMEPKIKRNMPSTAQKNHSGRQTDTADSKYQENASVKRRLRKISVEKLSSFGGAVQAAVGRRRKSVATEQPSISQVQEKKIEGKGGNWNGNMSSNGKSKSRYISSVSTDDGESESGKNSDSALFSTSPKSVFDSGPTSPLKTSCVHEGYLDFRNRKKRWDRYWCTLHDTCLYCYFSPQSDKSRDVILLQGYDVIADVKNLNRVRFIFHLQQQGFPNIYFSSDNHRDYLLWVGCLEKQINRDKRSRSTPDESPTKVIPDCVLSDQQKKSLFRKHRASLPNIRSTPTIRKDYLHQRSAGSQTKIDLDFVAIQKQNLLNELAIQKKQLMEEQLLLDGLPTSKTEKKKSPFLKRSSKDEILQQYEKQKIQEEMRAKNFQTVLNCRRNSFHIKMAHINKNMSPSLNDSGKRENFTKLVEMEKKLKETKVSLGLIDREIEEGNATTQHNLERLERKRDLEFFILEQQDAMKVMRQSRTKDSSRRQRRRSCDLSMTSSTARTSDLSFFHDDLTSSTLSSVPSKKNFSPPTYSNFVSSSEDTSHPDPFDLFSPPIKEKSKFYLGPDDDVTTDEDSGFQASNERLEGEIIDQLHHISAKSSLSNSSKQSSDVDGMRMSCSSIDPDESAPKRLSPHLSSEPEEIDSSIMAKIEDFEIFAKMKLREANKQRI